MREVARWIRMLVCLVSVLPLIVAAEDKRIVLGAQTAPDGSTYEIGFCARGQDAEGKGPGQAFVVLRSFDKHGKQSEFLTAGFGPPESKPVHGQGVVSPENYSDPTQQCLIADTNQATYGRTKQMISSATEFAFGGTKISVVRPYVVAFDDCVTFMQAVAQEFGLEVPPRIAGLLPVSFVNALVEAN